MREEILSECEHFTIGHVTLDSTLHAWPATYHLCRYSSLPLAKAPLAHHSLQRRLLQPPIHQPTPRFVHLEPASDAEQEALH